LLAIVFEPDVDLAAVFPALAVAPVFALAADFTELAALAEAVPLCFVAFA